MKNKVTGGGQGLQVIKAVGFAIGDEESDLSDLYFRQMKLGGSMKELLHLCCEDFLDN